MLILHKTYFFLTCPNGKIRKCCYSRGKIDPLYLRCDIKLFFLLFFSISFNILSHLER